MFSGLLSPLPPLPPLSLQVPIMLRSLLCSIKDMADRELMEVGECPYDQVRQEGVCIVSVKGGVK